MVVIILNKINYYVSKDKNKKETLYFEYEKMDGYKVNPKVQKKDAIKVNKIIFVNPELSEKIIRKKIDAKINYLLKQLKEIEEDDSDSGNISRNIMIAEKLRIQIINNYVKYLGHTYESLTLKKLEIIIEQLKYKLYINTFFKKREVYLTDDPVKEGKRGR